MWPSKVGLHRVMRSTPNTIVLGLLIWTMLSIVLLSQSSGAKAEIIISDREEISSSSPDRLEYQAAGPQSCIYGNHTSTDVPKTICDLCTVTSILPVTYPPGGPLDSITITNLNINHPKIGDLEVRLTSPNGTTVVLIDNVCGNSANIPNITLTSGATPIGSVCPLQTGSTYGPSFPFTPFIGGPVYGTWILTIEDQIAGGAGVLTSWGMNTISNCPPSPSPSPTRTPTLTTMPTISTPTVTRTSTACFGGSPQCHTPLPTGTLTITNTPTVSPTPTRSILNCFVTATGGTTSCFAPATYNFTTFCHDTPSAQATVYFEISETTSGPWVVHQQQSYLWPFPPGESSLSGSFTVSNIPSQYGWYRFRLQGQLHQNNTFSAQTAPAPRCDISTVTPVTSTPTVTPTTTACLGDSPLCHTPSPTVSTPTPTSSPCPLQFSDVDNGNTFYSTIRCLACRGIISGYSDGTFRPGSDVTRGQLSKIVANAAGLTEPVSGQTFSDVPPTHTFYEYIERMAVRGIIGGYSDGTFRPGNPATRGQIAKIVANAANFNEPVSGQTFTDVPPTDTFYEFIERMAVRGIIGGYTDGTFRPQNNATRGQVSKIVANTFFPTCHTP